MFVIVLGIPKLASNVCGGVTKEDHVESVFPAEEGMYIRTYYSYKGGQVTKAIILVKICYTLMYHFNTSDQRKVQGYKSHTVRICGIFRGSYISRITCLERFSRLNFH